MTHGTISRWIDWLLSKPLRHWLQTPEKMLEKFVRPGMTALDAGCGAGLYSLGMARLVGSSGKVVSVDTQPERVSALKESAARSGLSDRLEARVCTDRDLQIDDLASCFDFALAVYVVHHAADPVILMGNVHRALKPGGTFLVVEPRHHASAAECSATEDAGKQAGFTVKDHPKLIRDWAVRLVRK